MEIVSASHELTMTFNRLCDAPTKSVLVVGDLILDEYITGDVKRISPEAPVPIVEFRARAHVPGGAANVAANVAALGCQVSLAGIVGADADGKQLRSALTEFRLCTESILEWEERPTTVKLRILGHNQQIVRLDREIRTPIPAACEDALLARIEQSLAKAEVCILSDYGKGVVTPRVASATIELCRERHRPVLVDPKSLEVGSLRGATLVKPNMHEAQRLAACEIRHDGDFLDAGRHLASALPETAVLITRGAEGMSMFRHGLEPHHVPTVARNVYDVTGAGDTVIGTIAVALAVGLSLESAVWLASQSAAIVVEKLGTATVQFEELRARCQMP